MKWALLILKYLPSVLAGVTAVQQSVSSEVPGATKKQIVLDAMKAGSLVGEGVPEEHVAIVSALIDSTVTNLKASGVMGFTPAKPA